MTLRHFFSREIVPLIPEDLYMAILVRRRLPLIKNAGVIFIHIPKNAGTSINAFLYGQFMGHYKARHVQRYAPDLWESLPSFAITRNPWERLLSAYRYATANTRHDTLGDQGIGRPWLYRGGDFESFERFVHRWLPNRNLEREDPIFQPQESYVVGSDGKVAVSFLGRLDRMHEVQEFLEDVLKRKVEIGKYNRTGNGTSYKDAYTPEMRDIVAKAYEGDIKRFNYDF